MGTDVLGTRDLKSLRPHPPTPAAATPSSRESVRSFPGLAGVRRFWGILRGRKNGRRRYDSGRRRYDSERRRSEVWEKRENSTDPWEAIYREGVEPCEAIYREGVEPCEAIYRESVKPWEAIYREGVEPWEAIYRESVEAIYREGQQESRGGLG